MDIRLSASKIIASRMLSIILSFAGITYFARALGPNELGIFFLFQAAVAVLRITSDFGIRGAIEKRISGTQDQGQFLGAGLFLKGISIITIIISVLVFREQINGYIGTPVVRYIIIAILLGEFGRVFLQVIRAELRVGETALIEASRQLIWVTTGTFLISLGYGVNGVIYGVLVADSFLLVASLWKTTVRFNKPAVYHIKSLIDYGRYNFISTLSLQYFSWFDVLVIGYFLSQDLVGVYEIAWKVSGLTLLFAQAIRTTIFPSMSSWANEEYHSRIKRFTTKAIVPSIVLVIPVFFGSLVLGQELLFFVYGPEYTAATGVLVVLLAQKLIQALNITFASPLEAIDRPDLAARAMATGLVINIILNILLIPEYGIMAAAVASFVSYSVTLGQMIYYFDFRFGIDFPIREIGWCTLSAVTMMIFIIVIQRFIAPDNLLELVIFIILGCAVYCILLWSNKHFRIQTKSLVFAITNL